MYNALVLQSTYNAQRDITIEPPLRCVIDIAKSGLVAQLREHQTFPISGELPWAAVLIGCASNAGYAGAYA